MRTSHRILSTAVALALGVTPTMQATAEDIDLFVSAAAVAATNPNVLIVLDNSANWNSNSQHWPTPAGESGPFKQGESELRAIKAILNDLDPKNPRVNLGLMMLRRAGNDSGFLRYAIRPMDETNLPGFVELIGSPTCPAGMNSVNGTDNCILKNFSGTGVEQVSTAAIDYSAAMFETYKYFGGYTSPAYAQKDVQPPGAQNDRTHHKYDVYWSNDGSSRIDKEAYTDTSYKTYKSPIASPCAKNYVIFIGNGFPNQDGAGPLIANVNGGATPLLPAQQSVQNFTTTLSNVTDDLGTHAACSTNATCAAAAAAAAPGLYDSYSCSGGSQNTPLTGVDNVCHTNAQCVTTAQATFPGFSSYSCTGGSSTTVVSLGNEPSGVCQTVNECQTAAALLFPAYTAHTCGAGNATGCTGQRQKNRAISATQTCGAGTLINQTMSAINGTACTGSSFLNQTMQGNKQVTTIVPLSTFSTPTKVNYADEWAKFLYTTDVSELPGQQNVTTYTIDVFKDQQDADETALLSNMAKFGGGKYFQARNEQAIVDALRQILIEVQSVNSVFASASLPINATNRSQNENQVFIGMFRPDGSGNPRWFGNLKRYQIAQFGTEFKLGDSSTPPLDAVSTATGFIQPCAKSFWTEDSGTYWDFLNGSAGQCTTASTSIFSDSPDGPQVEKGAVAEVLRRGNNPPTTPGPLSASPSRTIYTCMGMNIANCCQAPAACGAIPATELVSFDATNVSKDALGDGAMIDALRDNIINFTIGYDINNENATSGDTSTADVRASVHGDVAHSRPLPVNYGDPTGVVLYYGANDGHFRAVLGSSGQELWSFVAPEHHAKLGRLTLNTPPIRYPNQDPVPAGATNKDYFFDGSAGLFQNADNSKIWIFPSMRRGGRMLYAFDVTTPTAPALKWRAGCPLQDKDDDCTPGMEGIGQTWSIPAVALIRGYDANKPVIVVGGGYDPCEDEDSATLTGCGTPPKGAAVYALDADTGNLLKAFGGILRSVPGDVTFVDRDFDGYADHGYVSDTGGGLYRIDFVNPSTLAPLAAADWTVTHIAQARSSGFRKFQFTPSALPGSGKVFLAIGSGDRERPLISNYPFTTPVLNRFYMFVDVFATTGLPVDLDDNTLMDDFTATTDCKTRMTTGSNGWFMDLNANGAGEQTVTASTIFAGLIFFSTNRPLPTAPGACTNELGEARGYAVNLLNASGAADTFGVCGGARSAAFAGGGLPPSPVTGTVPVGPNGTPVTVMIGGVNRGGGVSTPIGAQRVTPTITQRRSRIYWYMDGDK
jgi:Tfp pilus tip-associated adhesin PilY1